MKYYRAYRVRSESKYWQNKTTYRKSQNMLRFDLTKHSFLLIECSHLNNYEKSFHLYIIKLFYAELKWFCLKLLRFNDFDPFI